ncbi:type II toxin-antitoxin system RelE/ParE family toxin, partial [Vibrio splendidus]
QHRFAQKKGAGKGVYSIEVNGNWRITFEITDDGAIFIDYLDYHGKNISSRS